MAMCPHKPWLRQNQASNLHACLLACLTLFREYYLTYVQGTVKSLYAPIGAMTQPVLRGHGLKSPQTQPDMNVKVGFDSSQICDDVHIMPNHELL